MRNVITDKDKKTRGATCSMDEAYCYHRLAASEMNNVGAKLAEASQHRAAAEIFGDAVRAAKRAHALLDDESSASEDCGDNDVAVSLEGMDRARSSLASLLKTSKHGATTRPPKRRLYSKSGLMVYSNPLRTNASLSSIQQESPEERSSLGKKDLSAILFNLALVHHLRGCERGNVQSLKKALTSYNIALSIYSGSVRDLAKATGNKIPREYLLRSAQLNLGILNNIGSILSELGQRETSKQYFERLSRLLFEFDRSEAVAWEGFELNVLRTSSCPPPAA